MATHGKLVLPIYVRIGDMREAEVGTVEMDVDLRNGRVKTPTQPEIKAALRKALR